MWQEYISFLEPRKTQTKVRRREGRWERGRKRIWLIGTKCRVYVSLHDLRDLDPREFVSNNFFFTSKNSAIRLNASLCGILQECNFFFFFFLFACTHSIGYLHLLYNSSTSTHGLIPITGVFKCFESRPRKGHANNIHERLWAWWSIFFWNKKAIIFFYLNVLWWV